MSRLLLLPALLATLRCHAVSLQGTSRRSGFMSTATLARGVDYFNPTFVAPQLTPKQFLIISSPSEQKIVYTELKNFKATTGRTFALIDSGLSEPQGLALDHDRGALYVADKGAKKVLRFHVYVEDNGNGRQLVTDGVQLCVMQNADTSWVNVDINGDVFYSDATTKTINRIPVEVIDMLSKGSYSASDLTLVSEKTLEHGGGATSNVAVSRFVYSLYEGSANPHVSTPAGLVSDGARLYWTNSGSGKSVGSVVEGEVSPQLASGATSFPSTMLSNQSDTGYGMTKSSKYIFLSALNNGMGVVSGGPAGRKGLVLVSRSMVEVDRLDAEASRDCTRFDYVWVPSAQSREAFLESGVSKDRVKVLPEAVDTSAFSCRSAKVQPPFRFGAQALDDFFAHKPKQSFTFLSMFKWEPRKNWYGLLESFLDAFPEQYTSIRGPNGESRKVSVRLLVKTQILGWSPDDPRQDVPDLLQEKRLSEASLEGRLLVFHDFLNSSEIPKLFKAVDGFILPTHGEGWGLPLIEAMASGIPTISTGWGGHMDFMSKENSWPVSYDLVASQNYGARWAEPRKEALMEAMREVVAGGDMVRGKVDKGCDLVHQKYHIDAVANQAVELMIRSLEALHRS